MFGTGAGSEEEEAVCLDEEYIRPLLLKDDFFFPSSRDFRCLLSETKKISFGFGSKKPKTGKSVCFNLVFC